MNKMHKDMMLPSRSAPLERKVPLLCERIVVVITSW